MGQDLRTAVGSVFVLGGRADAISGSGVYAGKSGVVHTGMDIAKTRKRKKTAMFPFGCTVVCDVGMCDYDTELHDSLSLHNDGDYLAAGDKKQ